MKVVKRIILVVYENQSVLKNDPQTTLVSRQWNDFYYRVFA